MRGRNRFYIDCEFNGHCGELLSMAIIPEAERGLYLCVADAPKDMDPWVAANVWPLVHMRLPIGKTVAYLDDFGHFIRRFIGKSEHPVIVADSPVDIGRFCAAVSTGQDGGWSSTDYSRMTFEVHNVDCYPTDVPDAIQHNAYWDAIALRWRLANLHATGAA